MQDVAWRLIPPDEKGGGCGGLKQLRKPVYDMWRGSFDDGRPVVAVPAMVLSVNRPFNLGMPPLPTGPHCQHR